VRSADARRAPEPGAGCPACRGRARGSMQLLPGAGRLLLLRGACIILLRGACICYSLHSIACPGPGCCEAARMSYPAASHAAAGPVRSVPAREAHRVGAHQAHAARGPGAGGQAARAGPGPGRAERVRTVAPGAAPLAGRAPQGRCRPRAPGPWPPSCPCAALRCASRGGLCSLQISLCFRPAQKPGPSRDIRAALLSSSRPPWHMRAICLPLKALCRANQVPARRRQRCARLPPRRHVRAGGRGCAGGPAARGAGRHGRAVHHGGRRAAAAAAAAGAGLPAGRPAAVYLPAAGAPGPGPARAAAGVPCRNARAASCSCAASQLSSGGAAFVALGQSLDR